MRHDLQDYFIWLEFTTRRREERERRQDKNDRLMIWLWSPCVCVSECVGAGVCVCARHEIRNQKFIFPGPKGDIACACECHVDAVSLKDKFSIEK